jgi:Ni,Fe-hydrogenase I cytochrome b subunit
MSTTTASIFIGHGHPNDGGINPSHWIQFTEGSILAMYLYDLENPQVPLAMIPTVDHTIDDIYLMIVIFVLKGIHVGKDVQHQTMYEVFTEAERSALYDEAKAYLAAHRIKVIFNLFVECHLLNQLDLIKAYPEDVEITTPAFKKEYSHWSQQVSVSEF